MIPMEDLKNDLYISIVDIARIHRRAPGNVRRSLRSLGIATVTQKSGKPAKTRLYVSREDYEKVADRLTSGVSRAQGVSAEGAGYFYLVQLEPELDPARFKVGFSIDTDGRLAQHRTAAPFAVVVKTWSCKALWEQTAIDCITQGCERLSAEVFRGDLTQVQVTADRFFEIMPGGVGA